MRPRCAWKTRSASVTIMAAVMALSNLADCAATGPEAHSEIDGRNLTREDLQLIERSDVTSLRAKFIQDPGLVNATSYRAGACSPLAYAASLGHAEVVEALIELEGDLESRCHEERATPLMLAIVCSLQHEINHAMCPKHLASEISEVDNHAASAAHLLRAGASLSAADAQGRQPIHLAALNGNVDIVRLLLKHGADPSAVDSHGWTPVLYAVQRDDAECISELARAGGKVDGADGAGFSPLIHAVHLGHVSAVRTLRNLGASCAAAASSAQELVAAHADPATRRRLEAALGPSCLAHDEL